MAKLGWGGYLRPELKQEQQKQINALLEKDKAPPLPMDFLVRDFLNNGYTLKLQDYGGSPQWTAHNDEDMGDGMRYGVSAYADSLHLALFVLHCKLEAMEWQVPGDATPPQRGATWG